jgi:hypothetical protein
MESKVETVGNRPCQTIYLAPRPSKDDVWVAPFKRARVVGAVVNTVVCVNRWRISHSPHELSIKKS